MKSLYILILSSIYVLPSSCLSDPDFIFLDSTLTIVYNTRTIFSGKLSGYGGKYHVEQRKETLNGASYQMMTITSGNFARFRLSGTIIGSEEAIACESEPVDKGVKVVRHVYGESRSMLNNAVYDRNGDWLLSFDRFSPSVSIVPAKGGAFLFSQQNWEIVIRFRPEYYRRHRGLSYFHPSEYSIWKSPVAGWCSWFAYFDSINEQAVKTAADVLSRRLKPYGLTYLQIDDGYEQLPIGMPSRWLQPNEKFPSGLGRLAGYIASKGLSPGIWTNVSFADSESAASLDSLFVRDTKGNPVWGNWVGYAMDGSSRATLERLITPVYAEFRNQGWEYFKLDALRHLKYEGYNTHADYFERKNADRNEAIRNVVREVRRSIGRESFLLACWGIRPELTGLVDGCRIGSDGFSYAGLVQYNSYNNIVWRNDPDHIVLSEREAYRSCTATSLTGSLFMLTDKPEVYERSPLIDAAKRSLPVLFTLPGQVYDVDPSRSGTIALADVEMSGSGPRPFDAGASTTTGLFSLELSTPYEDWIVLGRLDERESRIPLKDLGLSDEKEYYVFEFWSKKFLGSIRKELAPEPIDPTYNCQVFCVREAQSHPQLIATNRHISCGGVDVRSLVWETNTLRGKSELVGKEEYVIYIHEPPGSSYVSASAKGGKVLKSEKRGEMRLVTVIRDSPGETEWEVLYK